jgi:hypothetical protein
MDPLTTIDLVSFIVQFVDFGSKLLDGIREIYFSTTRTTVQNATLEVVIVELRAWNSRLSSVDPSSVYSKEENPIWKLTEECQKLAKTILELIQNAGPRTRKSRTETLFMAVKDRCGESEKLQLREGLRNVSSQLVEWLEAQKRSYRRRSPYQM